jgi:predicted SAM-dependent methyltransferase
MKGEIKGFLKTLLSFIPANVLGIIYFEFRSLLGRTFTGKLKIDSTKRNFINLGCGPARGPEMINVDFFFAGADYGADLRYPLRIDSNSIDGIFSEHTLEHLTYDQNRKLLAECFRVLKPGTKIRVIVPDVSVFIEAYSSKNQAWFKEWERLIFTESADSERAERKLASPMCAISFITQEYFHQSSWDFETMSYFLKEAGFISIEKCEFRKGSEKNLLQDLDHLDRKLVSLYVEATKPLNRRL